MTAEKLIVGVCSGNIQRSPTFEAVYQHLLREERQDLSSYVRLTSAGTNVERYLTHTEEPARVVEILRSGLKYGIVPEIVKTEAEKYASFHGNSEAITGLEMQDREQLRLLHRVVRPLLSQMNIQCRNQALELRHVDYSRLASAKPLHPEQGYDIVIAMEEKALKAVQKRYNNAKPREQTAVVLTEVDIAGGRVFEAGIQEITAPEQITFGTFVVKDSVPEDTAGGLEGALACVDYFLETKAAFFEAIERRLDSSDRQ